MNPDVKSFVWFTAGLLTVAVGLAAVHVSLVIVPGAIMTAAGLLRRS